jgi:hypothetical protein
MFHQTLNTYKLVRAFVLGLRLDFGFDSGLIVGSRDRLCNEKNFLLLHALVGRVDDLISGELDTPRRGQLISVGAEYLVIRAVDAGKEEPRWIADSVGSPRSIQHVSID